jgi:hypothetical protein
VDGAGFLARIDWVLENRPARVKSAGAWSVAAGLTYSHVTTMRRRLREGADVGVEVGTATALADAAGVSAAWFTLGVGAPDDALPALVKRDPAVESLLSEHPEWSEPTRELLRACRRVGPVDLGSVVFWLNGVDAQVRSLVGTTVKAERQTPAAAPATTLDQALALDPKGERWSVLVREHARQSPQLGTRSAAEWPAWLDREAKRLAEAFTVEGPPPKSQRAKR